MDFRTLNYDHCYIEKEEDCPNKWCVRPDILEMF